MVNFQSGVLNAANSIRNLAISMEAAKFSKVRLEKQQQMAEQAVAKKKEMDDIAIRTANLKYEKKLQEQNIKLGEKQKKSDARVEQYAKDLASGESSIQNSFSSPFAPLHPRLKSIVPLKFFFVLSLKAP